MARVPREGSTVTLPDGSCDEFQGSLALCTQNQVTRSWERANIFSSSDLSESNPSKTDVTHIKPFCRRSSEIALPCTCPAHEAREREAAELGQLILEQKTLSPCKTTHHECLQSHSHFGESSWTQQSQ